MQIQSVTSTSFLGTKSRFISREKLEELNNLVKLMKRESLEMHNQNYSKIDSIISIENIKNRKDCLFFPSGSRICLTAGKTDLVIDCNSGKIIDHNKPFYRSWTTVFCRINKALSTFTENYDNSKIVFKERVLHGEFTKIGEEKIEAVKQGLV